MGALSFQSTYPSFSASPLPGTTPLLRLLHSQPPQGTLHLGGISSPVLENGLTPSTGSVYASTRRQYQSFVSGRLCPPRAPCVPEKVALSITPGTGCRQNQTLSGQPMLLQHSLRSLKHVPIIVFPLYQAAATQCPVSSLSKTSKTHPPPHHQLLPEHPHWAARCIGFFGFLRAEELITPDGSPCDANLHLSIVDISFHQVGKHRLFQLLIKKKKKKKIQSRSIPCGLHSGLRSHPHSHPPFAIASL